MAIFYSSEKISDDGNERLNHLSFLWSQYNEMISDGLIEDDYGFTEFIENEWLERHSLVDGWDDDNPDDRQFSTSYHAGKLLGEI